MIVVFHDLPINHAYIDLLIDTECALSYFEFDQPSVNRFVQVDDDTPGLLLLFSVEVGTSIFMFQEQIGLEYP